MAMNKDQRNFKRRLTRQIRKDVASTQAMIAQDKAALTGMVATAKKDGWGNVLNAMSGNGSNTYGWQNAATGLGVFGMDKRTAASVLWKKLWWSDVENLYAADDMAAKIVDTVPKEGTRKGFTLRGIAAEKASDLYDAFVRLNGEAMFLQAWQWARLYGGAAILVGVEDGQDDLSQPLDINRVQKIKSLTPMHRFELYWTGSNLIDDITSKWFGYPGEYNFISSRAVGLPQKTIHHSRLIRFEGARLPQRLFIANYYWHDSVLTRAFNPLRNFQTTHDSIAAIAQDFRQAIMSVKGLAEMLATDKGNAALISRLATFNQAKSVLNTVLIDKEETYTQQVASLTGIKDLLDNVNNRLVAASGGIPHTVLLGEGAHGGIGAKGGASENRDFYDMISSEQEQNFRPAIERFFQIAIGSKQFPNIDQDDRDKLKITFDPLWQMDDSQTATLHKDQAQADQMYIDMGVLMPDEVATNRFKDDGFNLQTTIDQDERDRAKALAAKVGSGESKPEAVVVGNTGPQVKP